MRLTGSTSPKAEPLLTDTVRLQLPPPATASGVAPLRQLLPLPPQSPELLLPLAVPRIAVDFRFPLGSDRLKLLEGLTATTNVGGETSRAAKAAGPIFSLSDVDDPPPILNDDHPQYPEELRITGVTGTVRLEYVIRADGRVDSASVRVLASTRSLFSASAIESLLRASFKPARRKGVAVPARVQQTIRFEKR